MPGNLHGKPKASNKRTQTVPTVNAPEPCKDTEKVDTSFTGGFQAKEVITADPDNFKSPLARDVITTVIGSPAIISSKRSFADKCVPGTL